MVNKKGWLRIVEASMAIIIVFGVLLALTNNRTTTPGNNLGEQIPSLLDEMAQNKTIREDVIRYNASTTITAAQQAENQRILTRVEGFVGERIEQSINHTVKICNPEELCSLAVYPHDADAVYSYERIISSTLESYDPKKVKLFLWRVH
ncbi:hypothetical protein KW805_03105 [Candidatus Pacearchaeota archaeon]|nr:hypothetical protein [Candidatus Pacearchaeota archaeon]